MKCMRAQYCISKSNTTMADRLKPVSFPKSHNNSIHSAFIHLSTDGKKAYFIKLVIVFPISNIAFYRRKKRNLFFIQKTSLTNVVTVTL